MPEEIVIVDAARTPLSPADQPSPLTSLSEIDLLNEIINGITERSGIDQGCIDEIHAAGIRADGYLESSRFWGFDILHSAGSSLGALFTAVNGVQADPRGVALVAGVNHSRQRGNPQLAPTRNGSRIEDSRTNAELLVTLYGLTRTQIDNYARQSIERAHECARWGDYKREIVPITSPHSLAYGGTMTTDILCSVPRVTEIELMKRSWSTEELAIPENEPVVLGDYAHTAVGAGAALVTSLRRANELGLTPRARIRQFTEVYRRPRQKFCNLPSIVTRSLLSACRFPVTSMDHVEIPDTFAASALAWQSEFAINPDLLNPRGGAIALGDLAHAAGLRSLATMLGALEDTGGISGLIIGSEADDTCHGLLIEKY
ncbi:hypothetical protein [Nocardia sp. NPDC004860]|uniref:hypothetical protein n=1 Tax=Nocardia sp. NPDC004860 TaxID=3154557 RepID=UPI0033AAF083